MKINTKITVTYGVTFEEITKHIPLITTDNDVINDGDIIQFDFNIDEMEQNLFFDSITGEFCFDSTTQESSKKVYEIGNVIQSHYYKYSSIKEFLLEENQEAMLNDIEEEIK